MGKEEVCNECNEYGACDACFEKESNYWKGLFGLKEGMSRDEWMEQLRKHAPHDLYPEDKDSL